MNDLQAYIGRDIKSIITQVSPIQRTSKDGNPYIAIEMTFTNGFKKLLFIPSAEVFAWTNAIDMAATSKALDLEL